MSSFPDGVYTPYTWSGIPLPCMGWCPGNPRHLNVDCIRASALSGPAPKPLCGMARVSRGRWTVCPGIPLQRPGVAPRRAGT